MLAATPTSFLCGIRDRDGRWLSLVRGRRQEGIAEIDWLMNRADLPHYSLATVVRSCLIEHEISLGTRRLYIEGGTSMPIRGSFLRAPFAEVTFRRDSFYAGLLKQAAQRIIPNHFLAATLRSAELTWQPW